MNKLFGTDGIRGTPGAYPLTDEMFSKIAQAAALHTIGRKESKKKPRIVIGKDTRLSGHQIERNLAENLISFGTDVFLAGIITTPGVSFLVKDLKADMGIMISASHNKAQDNGLKFFNAKGCKLSIAEEEKIEELIYTKEVNSKKNLKISKGKISLVENAHAKYVRFLTSTVKGLNLKGMRIALDCASGSGSIFARDIFKQLKAEVHSINVDPWGENINVGGAIEPTALKELVLKTRCDIGVALDGDGDRGILVDDKGKILDGDFILAIMADYFKKKKKLTKSTVVGTVMSNYGLKVFLEKIGAKMLTASVGDKFVLEALLNNNLNLGGEQSGHIIFLDYLPTPDGLLTALQVLKVIKENGLTLSKLTEGITKFPQILLNVKVKEKKPFEELSSLNERLQEFNGHLNGEGRILLRYSGTEPLARVMVEGRDKKLIEDIAASLAEQIKQEIGEKGLTTEGTVPVDS